MKISDFPITPIISLIIGKILGVIFAGIVFDISLPSLGYGFISKLIYGVNNSSEIEIISSYSDLFMFTVLSTGFIVSLLLYAERTRNNITQKMIEDYFKAPFEKTIYTATKLYGSAFVWLIILWITNFSILYNTLSGRTYLWIYLLIFSLSISLSIYLVLDLKREMQLAKLKLFNKI